LIGVRYIKDSLFSWWFNFSIFTIVVGSFSYFLYASYGTAPEKENTAIKFEPRLWNNAAKNVPIIDYGQQPQIETADGIPGFSSRTSNAVF
jgi:hypothetical protein